MAKHCTASITVLNFIFLFYSICVADGDGERRRLKIKMMSSLLCLCVCARFAYGMAWHKFVADAVSAWVFRHWLSDASFSIPSTAEISASRTFTSFHKQHSARRPQIKTDHLFKMFTQVPERCALIRFPHFSLSTLMARTVHAIIIIFARFIARI